MHKRAVIVCKGAFPKKDYPLYLLRSADIMVCCDGAAGALLRRGIEPTAIVGDMDSIPAGLRAKCNAEIVHNPDQETNDLTKAFSYLMENYGEILDEITILGATGKAEDHAIANISLLTEYETGYNLGERGIKLSMVSDFSTIIPVSDSCELHIGSGRKVSLFSPDPTLNIKSEGLQWKTDEVVFDNWWKATRNVSSADTVKLTLSHKSKVILIIN